MKSIAEHLPVRTSTHWGRGCTKCRNGIAHAPELMRACELHLERLVQAIDGQLTFCDCQAGKLYRVYLLNRRQALLEEARRDNRMGAFAAKLTHPDIEVGRAHIHRSYEMMPAPTVHGATKAAEPAATGELA